MFERMLWRVCRGNVFLRQAEIENPLEDPVTVKGTIVYSSRSLRCVKDFLIDLSLYPSMSSLQAEICVASLHSTYLQPLRLLVTNVFLFY